jgi:hypothetical protein
VNKSSPRLLFECSSGGVSMAKGPKPKAWLRPRCAAPVIARPWPPRLERAAADADNLRSADALVGYKFALEPPYLGWQYATGSSRLSSASHVNRSGHSGTASCSGYRHNETDRTSDVPPSPVMENGVIMQKIDDETESSWASAARSACRTVRGDADYRNAARARDSLPLVFVPARGIESAGSGLPAGCTGLNNQGYHKLSGVRHGQTDL